MQKVSKYKTARVYAQAWFSAACDKHVEDDVLNEVSLLRSSMAQDLVVWKELQSAVGDNDKQTEALMEFCKAAKFSDISSETLKLIAQNNKLNILNLILDGFVHTYYLNKGIVEVTVDTAVGLSPQQDKKLKQTLEKKLNAPVVINYCIKPEVLGGLAVRFKSFLFDDTLANKLKNVQNFMLDCSKNSNV